jgi:hypothetical protein
MIHSVAHWPRGARRASDLPDLLVRLVHRGLATLDDPAWSSGDRAGAEPTDTGAAHVA